MGRANKEVDYKVIDTALYYGATLKQLQFLLMKDGITINDKTISRRIEKDKGMTFTKYREYHQGGFRYKLIQQAIQMAMNGNSTMMIFCLKNLAGWTDKQETKIDLEKSKLEIVYKKDGD